MRRVLETATSERSQLIDSRTMQTLPAEWAKSSSSLAQLSAGVTVSEPGARDEQGYGFSANGARSLQNNFLLDGVDDNSNLPDLLNEANYVIMPSGRCASGVQVRYRCVLAEFGRANRCSGECYDQEVGRTIFMALFMSSCAIRILMRATTSTRLCLRIIRINLERRLDFRSFMTSCSCLWTTRGFDCRRGRRIPRWCPPEHSGMETLTNQLDLTSPTGVADCNGQPTYNGELFNTKLTQLRPPVLLAIVVFRLATIPTVRRPMLFRLQARTRSVRRWRPSIRCRMRMAPVTTTFRIRSCSALEIRGDIRVDQVLTHNDNIFYRFQHEPCAFDDPSDVSRLCRWWRVLYRSRE